MGEVWFASDDPFLPTPWKEVVDGTTGCLYYWNPETNTTQYEKPAYWVSSPSLSSSCSPGHFYPPPSTASNYDRHSQYPNLYFHHQTPAETVINGYTFPTQFPFPNHTYTPMNQPIYPQSQSMVEPIYTEFPYFHPASNINPLVPRFQSPCDLNPSIPTFVPQLQFSDPNLLSSSLSLGNYEPQPIPFGPNVAPALAVQTTDLDHSTPSKFPDPSFDFDEMAEPQLTCFHLEQTTELQEVSETAAPKSIIPLGGFENVREAYHTTILQDEYSSKTSFTVELVQTVAPRTAHSTTDTKKHACNHRPMEKLWDDDRELRPMSFIFEAIDTKKPFLSVDVVYGQMMGSTKLYPNGRATDFLLANSQRILDKSGGPLVHWELRSIVTEVARLYLNPSLEKPITSLGNMPEEMEPSAPMNHFCNLVVDVDNFSLVTIISGLKPILLSMSFVESPVILEGSLPESYEHGLKHEVVAFDKFLMCSCKGGFEYDVHLANLIERLTRNSQKFFSKMHGGMIESKCSVLYHWLPSSLNWDKKCFGDAFFSLKFSVSSVTLKFLPPEFYKNGRKFLNKAMVAASLENTGLKVVIGAHWKVMDYVMHFVGALVIVSVGHTISTDLVDEKNFGRALIVLELQMGLLIVVMLPFATMKQLLIIGINSDGLVIAPITDSCNKKLLVCNLIITAVSKKIWGPFISLEKCNLDGQFNFLVQCIFRIECQHMDRSCILHSCGKHLDQSHFLVQLQKNSGIIFFAILEQLKQTYEVICFVSLIEGYLVNYLLSSKAKMSEHWSNKSSKFGECWVHELSQCMDKMKISSKLDNTSWKLVVIKSVKVLLTQAVSFYYYVMWLIPLVILHFGCGSYFFLYECVGHFKTDAENPTIINRGAKDDNMLSCELATGALGHLKLYGLLEFSLGHLQGEPTLLMVASAIFSVATIELGHHNSSLEQADDLLKLNLMVIPLGYRSGAHLILAYSIVVLELLLTFPAHAPSYSSPSHYIIKLGILTTFWIWLLTPLSSFKDWMITLHGLVEIWSHGFIGNTFFKRKLKFVHESHITPIGTMATELAFHSGEDLHITNSDLRIEYSALRQITNDLHRLYFTLWCLLRFTYDIPNDVVWSGYWRLDYTLPWDLMLVDHETTPSTLTVIYRGATEQSKIAEYMVQNSQGAISQWDCSTNKNDTMLPECLTFYIGAFCFNASVMIWEGQLTSKLTTQALCDDHEVVGRAISIPPRQTAQVLSFLIPREENHAMLATSIILTTPSCKLLGLAVIMEACMDEGDGMIKKIIERRMVSAEIFSTHFPIPTSLRPEDMPLFKGGGMLGLLCYNYLLSLGNVLGYLNGLYTYIGLYNYMGNWIRVGSYCKRVFRVCCS